MISISKLLNEGTLDKIFHLDGILIVDDEKRNQKDILSDIRALPAITVVRNIEMEQDPTEEDIEKMNDDVQRGIKSRLATSALSRYKTAQPSHGLAVGSHGFLS